MKYLLDTDVFSEAARARNATLRRRFHGVATADLALSAITLGEIEFGLNKNRPAPPIDARIRALRDTIHLLAVDAAVAAAYGKLRDLLRRKGTPIGPNDCWIAAHALAAGLTLATGNEREFSRVPGLDVENWLR